MTPSPNSTSAGSSSSRNDLVKDSLLYKEFLAEREEILRHKWIESEKAGHDIGFEKALLDWIVRHRSTWRALRSASGWQRALARGILAAGAHLAAHSVVENLFVNNVHLHVASLLGMLAAAQPRTTKAAQ